MKRSTIATALALLLGFSIGAPSLAAPTAPPQSSSSSHHTKKTQHVQTHPAKPSEAHPAVHPIAVHHTTVRTTTTVRTHATVTTHHVMPSRPATTRRVTTTRRTVVRKVVRTTSWRTVSQPMTTFIGRERVEARAVALSDDHVIVSMPNGTMRTFVAFRESGADRDRQLVFRDRDDVRAFRIVKVSEPVVHRVIVFTRREEIEREPEIPVLRAIAPVQDEIVAVAPNDSLVPLALTTIQPLPFGQMAFVTDNVMPTTFVPTDVSFVGQPISVIGDLVTFMLPDGSTRTLVDTGPLPTIGTQVAVVENGQQIVSMEPAVTNFVGQVVAAQSPFVTFEMPNGTIRTLTTVQPIPVPGTRAVVFEDGDRVTRFETL
ncbi:MAG TPA: hypothetical protein VEV38_03860 [Candidatus Eremiobacteraceae bacterium]|nr:hypothetical protein [Candidatus Eremiobacteraceae bacterium]